MNIRVADIRKSVLIIPNIGNLTVMRIVFYMLSCVILFSLGESMLSQQPADESFMTGRALLFFLMGIVGATIASSTGAGGGIVFLPIFISQGFSPLESLSTSIAIQCFGMSSGALAWVQYQNSEKVDFPNQWKGFYPVLLVALLSSCAGILLTLRLLPDPYIDIELLFSVFSLFVGSYILARTLKVTVELKGREKALSRLELMGLVLVSFFGGVITAWISVGVGELLLIFLIIIGVRLNVAVAVAVCVSAVSVLAAVPYFISKQAISLDVLVFAAPGALIGGFLARHLAVWLGAHKLKIAASGWIILSSLPYLTFHLID